MESTAQQDMAVVQRLMDRHFDLWNERQPDHWSAGFPGVYTEDVMVADYAGMAVGYASMAELLRRVQSAHPGFMFTPAPATWNHGVGRVTWGYGPQEDPDRVRGEDIFTLRDGKLASLRVFIDKK